MTTRLGRAVDPFKPHGFFLEEERLESGTIAGTATIFLTNKGCPWRCLMCDLWKNTLPHSVPVGAIPKQIEFALHELGERPAQVKLYNSGSFFDAAAIPVADYQAIARTVDFADNVVVESHPRLVGEKTIRLRDLLQGSLEVAMGLETVHPEGFVRLNKRFELDDFARATGFMRKEGIGVRAFVLVNAPFVKDGVGWAVKSARFAFECGVGAVSLIPTRTGDGMLDMFLKSGEFVPPTLAELEEAQEQTLALRGGRVFADTWDLQKFAKCPACLEKRRERLHRMNLMQRVEPRILCAECQ